MEQNPIAEEEGEGPRWWVILIFVLIFIIILLLIGFALFDVLTREGTRRLNESCVDEACVPGLVCDRGLCKERLGGTCSDVSDCDSTATACFESNCVNTPLSDIGGKAPCKPGLINNHGMCKMHNDGKCDKNFDCLNGSSCHHGKCKKENKEHHHRRRSSNNSRSSRSSDPSSSSRSSDNSSSSRSSDPSNVSSNLRTSSSSKNFGSSNNFKSSKIDTISSLYSKMSKGSSHNFKL